MAKQKAEKDKELEVAEVVFEESGDSDVGAVKRHLAEETEIVDIEDDLGAKLKQCKEKLALCQKERQEYLDGWQRSKADYLNQKRRLEEERRQEIERNAAHFIEKLLPLCDSFDLALQNLAKQNGAKSEWHAGIEQIYNQLMTVLKSYNVEVLVPLGLPFDPHVHEAVEDVSVTNPTQHHIIMDVLQNGYRVGERLIRPAKVVVGNYQSEAHTNSKEND